VLIGTSAHIRSIDAEAAQAARSHAKVLITGESGVGKEVVARLIHARSARSARPFIVINCAGVPDTLLESEFFGHTRGSFTGAYRDHSGLLQQAEGGTVFLDEVGEMSPRLQATLLRFLETSEIQRVGAAGGNVRVDVRIIAATNRVLTARIADGAFREDLYYRLNVVNLEIAPLRERPDDIEPLMRHFLSSFAERYQVPAPVLTPATIAQMKVYHWPGNAREVRNIAERLVIGKQGDVDPDTLISLLGAPAGMVMASRSPAATFPRPSAQGASATAQRLFALMVEQHQSFWTVVHAPFMARTLVRDDVRGVVHLGLQQVRGSYRHLLQLFNMPPGDYKKFLNFLNSAECQLPFQEYRPSADSTRHGRKPDRPIGD
jgi:transcriptional regulator with PAS, ATPase and Fis domain